MIGLGVVSGLAITPIKGTRLREVDRVALGRSGVREDRRFLLVDDRDRMINGKHLGELNAVVADYDDADRRLRITFPDGRVVDDEVRLDGPIDARFYSGLLRGRLVAGPWSEAISAFAGQPLRLLEAGEHGAVDRGALGAASLISRASLAQLAAEGGCQGVDGRRFRMLIEVDGIAAHREDDWVGREVQIGDALVTFKGHVGRCLITSRDPDTGVVDLPTLDILREYRGDLDTTEPLPFGIYGSVLEPGVIRVGDPLILDR
ncbi:MAG TPA: MOSC N-terminal beta barrel domain-containing protein [Solirubrobacteraceae bacterium]